MTERERLETDLEALLLSLSLTNSAENSLAPSSESGSVKQARKRHIISCRTGGTSAGLVAQFVMSATDTLGHWDVHCTVPAIE